MSFFGLTLADHSITAELKKDLLRLNPAEVNLKKGHSERVTPQITDMPDGVRAEKFEWTSSDPQVAEYRNGEAYGTGKGQAVLTCTATLTDGTVLTAECEVTVTVPVTGIRASAQNMTVMTGDVFVPEVRVLPEDAGNQDIRLTSSDEQILTVGEDGQVTALKTGRANLTAVSKDNPSQQIRITVTVAKRIGKTNRELTFLGLPWESDCETCISLLAEKGFVSPETRRRCTYTGTAWHWPENDLLFSRTSSWRTLPVAFSDYETGAARTSITPLKTIGGYLPQTATLIFLNGETDGCLDPQKSRLIGVYFNFDNRHERGAAIFCGLLKRLENEYGEFHRYLSADIPKYYQDLYSRIETVMDEAKKYEAQEPGFKEYLGEYAICTIRGAENTGIMLNMDTNEQVTLFYGRTDAPALIREIEELMKNEAPSLEDAGV